MSEAKAPPTTIADLLAGATDITDLHGPGKSGARLQRLRIAGDRYVVKYLDMDGDWTMRAAGIPGGATAELWRRGILDRLPACFNQPIVAIAEDTVTALLMRDVGPWLVPVSDDPIALEQHLLFVDHMAALHAAFWEAGEEIDLVSSRVRYQELSPATAEREAALGSDHLVPQLVAKGWPLLSEVAPRTAQIVVPLAHDPTPLVDALAALPSTFVHGNWKLDNLGTDHLGRTVLIDWETPGRGAALSDLAWYLSINCRRLPQSKEDTIEAYRTALERHGVATESWWEPQLRLCLLGALVQFGWEKAFSGRDDELVWWEERAIEGAGLLA